MACKELSNLDRRGVPLKEKQVVKFRTSEQVPLHWFGMSPDRSDGVTALASNLATQDPLGYNRAIG